MSSRSFICAATFLFAVLTFHSAGALEGSFTGTASGLLNDPTGGTQTPFFGEPVTGNFSLDTMVPLTYPDGCCDPPSLQDGSLFYSAFVFQFSLHAFDHDITSANLDYFPNGVTWADDGLAQSLTVTGGGPYWNWTLGLVDPDGGLFRNLDPATFDATQVDISQSYFSFSDDIRSYQARVAFDSLTLDGHAQQVPEPATLGLLGIGLLLLPLTQRLARRRTPAVRRSGRA